MLRKVQSVFVAISALPSGQRFLLASCAVAIIAIAAIGQIGLLDGSAGAATTPEISGSYAFYQTGICQTAIFETQNGPNSYVNSFVVNTSGNLAQTVGTAVFNAKTHMMNFSGA
jgi:hypothetical protein